MSSPSATCTVFSTSHSANTLERLLLDRDNSTGPMGSGGYAIRQKEDSPAEAKVIGFEELDCAPARRHLAFITDGKIWVTHLSSWVLDLLRENGIDFTTEQSANPPFIENYVRSLPARS